MKWNLIAVLPVLLLPATAHAYIGPGLGAGTLGLIAGILGTVVLALFGLFWYPLKRLIKRKKKARTDEQAE